MPTENVFSCLYSPAFKYTSKYPMAMPERSKIMCDSESKCQTGKGKKKATLYVASVNEIIKAIVKTADETSLFSSCNLTVLQPTNHLNAAY